MSHDHEPWPGRVDAFLTACQMFAGQREYAVETTASEILRGFAEQGSTGKTGPAGR